MSRCCRACFHLPAPWDYRNPFGTTPTAAEIAAPHAPLLEDEIAFQGADTIAAFIMEPVLGAGGVIVPHASFMPLMRGDLRQARHPADRRRSDHRLRPHRCLVRHRGCGSVKPDMMCTAKAITNGYFPFGAVMIHEKLTEVFETSKSPLGDHRPRLHLFRPSGRRGGGARLPCRNEAA